MSEKQTSGSEPDDRDRNNPEFRYVPVEYVHAGGSDEDEIDLLDLIKTLWEGRKVILTSIVACLLLGLFIYFFGAREYESEAMLIQEQQQQQIGVNALQQQFTGRSLALQSEGIPSTLYPRIIESAEFQLRLATREVEFESLDTTLTALTYFNEYYNPPITRNLADGLV
ncbi:MAG: Wzz/FepE/Etk N-terminal domain-containing protein, partial [Balneolaceae bacterium]